MELICYTYSDWKPRIRPGVPRRDWMDATPESYAYRCLPLSIANSHGWEVLAPCGFSARWNGGPAPEDVRIEADPGASREDIPEALFGSGTLTFHIAGIIRTPPGWDLWAGGPPNAMKDGIAPLSGIVETDWSPFTFTMNWRFTRPDHSIRFEENEPFAFLFPLQRGQVEQFIPRVAPIEEAPELKAQFEEWSRSRDAFQERMRTDPPSLPADKWQKFYYRGLDASGCPHISEHRIKVKPAPFAGIDISDMNGKQVQSQQTTPPQTDQAQINNIAVPDDIHLGKGDWLLRTLNSLSVLSPRNHEIARYPRITGEQFLDDHYAPNRPALLTEEIADWPALRLWSPAYLKEKIGSSQIEYQGGRSAQLDYERYKDNHKAVMPFDDFVDLISSNADGNNAYITAYNSGANTSALSPLAADLGSLDHILAGEHATAQGMMWIGAAGTFTPLHHDLTNNLLVQITGTKHIVMVPPSETPRLHNDRHVFSTITDLENADLQQFPETADLTAYRVELRPGEALFIPVGWWHQVVAEDFSVSLTFTNFRWRNDFYKTFPAD